MDEQRMLAEIERRLAAEDPGLASNLTSFRKPSRASVLRSTRARVIGSLFTVIVVAVVSLMVYAMLPFRSGGRAASHHPVTTASTSSGPAQAKIGAAPDTAAAAKTSPAAKTSSGQSARDSSSSAPARASASGGTHTSGAPAVAQSGTGASGAVHGP
jgi:cytoskeletal protein RodZ